MAEVYAGNAELAERKKQAKVAEVEEDLAIAAYIRQRDAREQVGTGTGRGLGSWGRGRVGVAAGAKCLVKCWNVTLVIRLIRLIPRFPPPSLPPLIPHPSGAGRGAGARRQGQGAGGGASAGHAGEDPGQPCCAGEPGATEWAGAGEQGEQAGACCLRLCVCWHFDPAARPPLPHHPPPTCMQTPPFAPIPCSPG